MFRNIIKRFKTAKAFITNRYVLAFAMNEVENVGMYIELSRYSRWYKRVWNKLCFIHSFFTKREFIFLAMNTDTHITGCVFTTDKEFMYGTIDFIKGITYDDCCYRFVQKTIAFLDEYADNPEMN